jgi:flagellar M-ring protein FliF
VAIATVKSYYGMLPRPARTLIVVTAGLAILFGAFITYQKANEPYASLFSQLDREDAAAIVAKLKEKKVPYRVGPDGTTIEVPEAKTQELRLELAGGGLPRGGGVGFESFDKMRLGATDFEQRVLYRRALEGELVRTITTLGAVESARVHLVLPEKSVFVSRSEPASASIVLRLKLGRSLDGSEVGGIVHLVAAAVPSLQPDHIAVVTTDGVTLHRPRKSGGGEDDDLGSDEDVRSVARSYESSTEERVRAMLDRVLGPNHADVRVSADVDSARVERLEEHFDPSKTALRSEESSIERSNGEIDETVAGVPGAESNLPQGSAKGGGVPKPVASAAPATSASASASGTPPPPPVAANGGSVRESHTRNFEIDKVSEKRVSGGAALRRLAVAVVLDGTPAAKGAPRSREELDKIAALVRSAAGISDVRGDVVTVESLPFADSEPAAEAVPAVPPSVFAKLTAKRPWLPYAAGGAVVVLLFAGVGIAATRRGRSAEARLPSQLTAPAISVTPALEASSATAALGPVIDSADLRTQAHSRATQDPATAALVLRFWLGTSTPDPRDPAAKSAAAKS